MYVCIYIEKGIAKNREEGEEALLLGSHPSPCFFSVPL
jgi:hypothetical protein